MLERHHGGVFPARVDAALRLPIGVEIGRHHEAVAVAELFDERAEAPRLVRRERTGADVLERLPQTR